MFRIFGRPRVISVLIIIYLSYAFHVRLWYHVICLTYHSLHRTIHIYYFTVCLGNLAWSSNLESLSRLQLLQGYSACHDLLAEIAFSSLPSPMTAGFVKAGEPESKTEVTVLCKLTQRWPVIPVATFCPLGECHWAQTTSKEGLPRGGNLANRDSGKQIRGYPPEVSRSCNPEVSRVEV